MQSQLVIASQFRKVQSIFSFLSQWLRRKPRGKDCLGTLSKHMQSLSSYLLWSCFWICPGRAVQLGIKNSVGAQLWYPKKETDTEHSALLPIRAAIKHEADALWRCRHW